MTSWRRSELRDPPGHITALGCSTGHLKFGRSLCLLLHYRLPQHPCCLGVLGGGGKCPNCLAMCTFSSFETRIQTPWWWQGGGGISPSASLSGELKPYPPWLISTRWSASARAVACKRREKSGKEHMRMLGLWTRKVQLRARDPQS